MLEAQGQITLSIAEGVEKDEIFYYVLKGTSEEIDEILAGGEIEIPTPSDDNVEIEDVENPIWKIVAEYPAINENEKTLTYVVHRLTYTTGIVDYSIPAIDGSINYIENITEPALTLSKHIVVKDNSMYFFDEAKSSAQREDPIFTNETSKTYSMKLNPEGIMLKPSDVDDSDETNPEISYFKRKDVKVGTMHIIYDEDLDSNTINISSFGFGGDL